MRTAIYLVSLALLIASALVKEPTWLYVALFFAGLLSGVVRYSLPAKTKPAPVPPKPKGDIYCFHCKHRDMVECNHPNEKLVRVEGNAIVPPIMVSLTRCSDKNANNDCSDFETHDFETHPR